MGLGPVLLVLFILALAPDSAHAQIDVTAGILLVPGTGNEGSQSGPALSVWASPGPGLPLFFEASAARIDLVSLGQAYHNNHLFLALGLEWVRREGKTTLGLRLGLGGYRESQVVESDPPRGGGINWAEMVLPGVSVARDLSAGHTVVLSISDAVIGPFYAVLDPSEYGVEHQIRFMLGIRF